MRLDRLDLFRKIPRDLSQGTSVGGLFSIAALSLMALLVVFEFAGYMQGRVDSSVIMDDNTAGEIQLTFKISLFELPCAYASVDMYDYLGRTKMDVNTNIFKSRLGANGLFEGVYKDKGPLKNEDGVHDENLRASKELVEGTFPDVLRERGAKFTFVNYHAGWCIHCQRLKPTWEAFAAAVEEEGIDVAVYKVDCVNHQALCSEQNIMGYPTLRLYHNNVATKEDYAGHRTVNDLIDFIEKMSGEHAQHARQRQPIPMRSQFKEGCSIAGHVLVNRVPGNIRLHARSDNHEFEARNTNVSHEFQHLSFLDPQSKRGSRALQRLPKRLVPNYSPLDGKAFVNPVAMGMKSHDHYLKVVSTHYRVGGWSGLRREVTGYQMTVSSHMFRPDMEASAVPEVRISYDLSPTAILITDGGAKRWYEFLTSLCAIVGGVFTVVKLMDSATYSAVKKMSKSNEGKLS